MLIWLFKLIPKQTYNGNFWVLTTVLFASILAIFMLAPIHPLENNFSTTSPDITTNDTLIVDNVNVDTTVTTPSLKDTLKKIDVTKEAIKTEISEPAKHKSGYTQYFSKIDTGRKTLCFFVPGCDHCRTAAKELTELRKTNKNFPEIAVVFMNEEVDLIPDFFKEAGAEYPYKIIEVIPFWKVLGSGKDTPGVKYLWNGNEYKYYWGINENKFDPIDYQKLINIPYSDLKK